MNYLQCVLHVLTWPAWFVCDVPSIHRHGDPRHRGTKEMMMRMRMNMAMKMIVMIVVVMMNEWNNENDGDVRLANLEITDSFIFSNHLPDHPTNNSSCEHNHPKLG